MGSGHISSSHNASSIFTPIKLGDKVADFIYPSNFILKGLYQNLCSNIEKNITTKLKDNNNAVDSELCGDFITLFSTWV